MCSRILLRVCGPVFHLLNLPNLEDYPYPIGQFLVMPASSHHNFGNKRLHHIEQKRTQRSKTSIWNEFREKKNKEYWQNKHKTPATISPTSSLRPESRDLINLHFLPPVEKSISEAQLVKIVALHA